MKPIKPHEFFFLLFTAAKNVLNLVIFQQSHFHRSNKKSSGRCWTMLGTRPRAGWQASDLEPYILSRWGATQWASTAPGRPESGATGATRPPPPHPAGVRLFHDLVHPRKPQKVFQMRFRFIFYPPSFQSYCCFLIWPRDLCGFRNVCLRCTKVLTTRSMIINLWSAIKVRKTMSVCPVLTSGAGRSKPHVTRDTTDINGLLASIEIFLPMIEKKWKRVGRTFKRVRLSGFKDRSN